MDFSDEEINEEKVKNKDILSEEEMLDFLDMKLYRKRIENILGRQYSYLFFDYFENIYFSKIRNKMSESLKNFLKRAKNNQDSLWMKIYKSIKFYSKENVPILIEKYFNLKAIIEFKYIYNESRKYTIYRSKFIDVYIKKMKKINLKKLKESKLKTDEDIFNYKTKQFFIKSFFAKKSALRPKLKLSKKQLSKYNEEENSNSTSKEEEMKNKKQIRAKLMKQVRQMKINSIREVEKANILQNKQKKKYGDIKSRFFDFYESQKNLKIFNYKSTPKKNNNLCDSYNININKEENNLFFSLYNKKSMSISKLSSLFPKENNYLKKNNNYSKYYSELIDDINNNIYYSNTQSISRKNKNNFSNYRIKHQINLINNKKKNMMNNKKILFNFKLKNSKYNSNNKYNIFNSSNKNINTINNSKMKKSKLLNNSKIIKERPNSYHKNSIKTKLIINRLEKKRNIELFNNLISKNCNNDSYNNKIFELFKNTENF